MECPDCGNEYKSPARHIGSSSCSYPTPDKYETDIIVGALMGDGTIMNNSNNCQMAVISTTLEYLEYLKETLPDWMCNSIFKSKPVENRKNPEKCNDCYSLPLVRHDMFNGMRETWYKSGKKKFPESLSINPTRLRHWYVTDGSLSNPDHRSHRAKISNVLESDNPEIIESLFDDVGIEINYDGHTNYRMSVEETEKFFEYIGHEHIPGFKYKWP